MRVMNVLVHVCMHASMHSCMHIYNCACLRVCASIPQLRVVAGRRISSCANQEERYSGPCATQLLSDAGDERGKQATGTPAGIIVYM